jgi:hypothetical protein
VTTWLSPSFAPDLWRPFTQNHPISEVIFTGAAGPRRASTGIARRSNRGDPDIAKITRSAS